MYPEIGINGYIRGQGGPGQRHKRGTSTRKDATVTRGTATVERTMVHLVGAGGARTTGLKRENL
jgi:hypothetical protein